MPKEIIVTSAKRIADRTICICKHVNGRKKFTIEIAQTSFGFDWNQDGDLYINAFLTSYINKAATSSAAIKESRITGIPISMQLKNAA